jgi:hypothetical protein
MQYPNLFKRIIPFALALMLGLFVASFFVSLTPRFRSGHGRMSRHWGADYLDLKTENEELKLRVKELEEKYEVPCEETEQAGPRDLLDRRCFADELPKAESERRKQLDEMEKQLTEKLKKLDKQGKK